MVVGANSAIGSAVAGGLAAAGWSVQPADVAAAVLSAVSAPPHACVTEIDLQPLRSP